MTDWPSRLRAASFNGQPFYVESGDVEAGHRVSTTGVPNGRHINESFGPAARKFEVEAYLTGDLCLVRAEALLGACESSHRGVLVLPDSGARLVRLTKAKRSFEKDKLGYVALTLEAVAEPDGAGLRLSANQIEAQIYAVAALVSAAVGLFAGAAFGLRGQPSPVRDAALEAAAGPLGDLVALRDAARLPPLAQASLDAPFTAATAALAGFVAAPAAYGAALAQAAIALGDAADPATLAETIVAFGRPADPPPARVSRGTALVIAENAVAGVTLTAASRALALGEAMARRVYADRVEAVAARSVAMAVFDDALARIGRPGLDLARELSAQRGLVAELVSRREADLAPLITVEAGLSLPSLWWAWRLYADPLRAGDLARRAGAHHPSIMPARFEALAA